MIEPLSNEDIKLFQKKVITSFKEKGKILNKDKYIELLEEQIQSLAGILVRTYSNRIYDTKQLSAISKELITLSEAMQSVIMQNWVEVINVK